MNKFKSIFIFVLLLSFCNSMWAQGVIKRNPAKDVKSTSSSVSSNKTNNRNYTTSGKYIETSPYVDLGLPSEIYWASCNLGANSPEQSGGYYAWGELQTKSSYAWSNYFDTDSYNGSSFKQFCRTAEMPSITCGTNDAATMNLGIPFCIPSGVMITELFELCKWEFTTYRGVSGCAVTGPNGKSIFIPAAGYKDGTSTLQRGTMGNFMSGNLYEDEDKSAYCVTFTSKEVYRSHIDRYCGLTIRPAFLKPYLDYLKQQGKM